MSAYAVSPLLLSIGALCIIWSLVSGAVVGNLILLLIASVSGVIHLKTIILTSTSPRSTIFFWCKPLHYLFQLTHRFWRLLWNLQVFWPCYTVSCAHVCSFGCETSTRSRLQHGRTRMCLHIMVTSGCNHPGVVVSLKDQMMVSNGRGLMISMWRPSEIWFSWRFITSVLPVEMRFVRKEGIMPLNYLF